MKRILLCILFSGLSACAGSTLSKGEPPELKPNEGLVTFVVVANRSVNLISMRKNPDSGAGLSIPYTDAGTTLHVLRADAGEYCVHQFRFPMGTWTYDGARPCFSVRPGKLVYATHITVDMVDLRFNARMEQHQGDAEGKIREEYPTALAGFELESVPLRGRDQ